MEGLDSFLCGWDVVWDEVNVDRRLHSHDQLMRGYLEGVMSPRVVCILCYWE